MINNAYLNIVGLDKAELLLNLYDKATSQGSYFSDTGYKGKICGDGMEGAYGNLNASRRGTIERARLALKSKYFDYVDLGAGSRPLKLSLDGWKIDIRMYDLCNGDGLAAEIVHKMKVSATGKNKQYKEVEYEEEHKETLLEELANDLSEEVPQILQFSPTENASSTKKNKNSNQNTNQVDISGLDKTLVLMELHRSVKRLDALTVWCPNGNLEDKLQMSYQQAQKVRSQNKTGCFNYVHGRLLQVDLSGNYLNATLYDRDNGKGAAAAAINRLRKKLKYQNAYTVKTKHMKLNL